MKMKTVSITMLGLLSALFLATSAGAQPVLNRVEQLMRDQVAGGKNSAVKAPGAAPGYLGLIADDRQEGGRGVRVIDVMPDGPAAQGGLKDGDLITSINGQPVRAMDDMGRALMGKSEGAKVTFTVNREGKDLENVVTLGRRPRDPAAGKSNEPLPQPGGGPNQLPEVPSGPRLGVRTLPISEEIQRLNNLPTTDGALVVAVKVGSPADRAGIPVNAIITGVDDQAIKSPQDLTNAVRAATQGEIALAYLYRGEEARKTVSLALREPASEPPKLELHGQPPEAGDIAPLPDEAPPPSAPQDRIATLEARIRELEQRIEKLEAARPREPE